MNADGWKQGGTFMALLSTMSYHFLEEDGRIVTQKWADEVASALSLLIFELYVCRIIIPSDSPEDKE